MSCPKVIANALFDIQCKVKRLVHDQSNNFANYRYVSIDAYYEAVRPWMNQAGIMLVPQEDESGISPDGKTYKVKFSFLVLHKDGEMWDVPIRRTVYLGYTGAQSCGSALSYAEKFLMRTLFKIPTGEYDPQAEDGPDIEAEKETRQSHDADSTMPQKQGQDMELKFDYSGAPYRVFSVDKSVKRTFTAVQPWGMLIKKELQMSKSSAALYEANKQEIERISKDIDDDSTLTKKAKENLKTAIEGLKQFGEENDG